MSLTGKGTLSLRKKDVQQQKSAGTAYRRLMFAHKANAGETGINLTALVQPSEMAALGFVNPNAGDILAANILFYKKNLTVISSARGILMQDLSYTVPTSSRIEFQGFTALQDEIFTCVLETGVKDGLTLLDAAPLVSTGTLLAGQTDYNVGTPFKVGEYINSQHGAVMVSVDGQLMLRNTSNQPAGVGIQGDYYEVNNGSGLGTIIRFNTPDLINDRSVSVVSIGSLVERPDGSMTAAIESLAGQIDQMIPTLAAVAGVPENTFQGAPNNQDLKAFGDRVLSLEQSTDARLDALESPNTPCLFATRTSTPVPSSNSPFIFNTKAVENNISYNTSTGLATILKPGVYEISGQFQYSHSSASGQYLNMAAQRNGANAIFQTHRTVVGTVTNCAMLSPALVRCSVGDTLALGIETQNITGIATAGDASYVSIKWIRD